MSIDTSAGMNLSSRKAVDELASRIAKKKEKPRNRSTNHAIVETNDSLPKSKLVPFSS